MEKNMTKGNPVWLILLFSVPILIGNVFQQIYNIVDAVIVGRYVNVEALAAVGATGSMSFLVLGFVWGLTGGFAVILAQKYGGNDTQGVRHVFAITVYLCVIGTVVLTFLGVVTAKPLLKIMNTPPEIMDYAYSYIIIIYFGIAVTFLYNMMACTLRAMGDSITPLVFLAIAALLNVVLDLLFIIVFHMEVAGAAYATVISQGVSGVLCLVYALKRYPILRLQKKDWTFDGSLAIALLKQGIPMALQFSITAIGVVILQSSLNLFGTTMIAAYTAASKVEQLVTQPAVTFGVTMANYTGQNFGAGKFDRIRDGVKKASVITILFSVLAGLIVVCFGEPLTRLFIDEKDIEVIHYAQVYLRTIAVFFPALNILFIYRNALQGLGRSLMPFMAGVFELLTRTVVAFTLPQLIGFKGICYAGPLAWVSAAIPLAIAYFYIIGKFNLLHKNATREAHLTEEK